MRPFIPFEEKNMAFMVNHNVEFTLVQLTATGLKKGIMDATAPMRSFFLEKSVHNYGDQLQGKEHKRFIKTVILDGATYHF